MVRRGDRKRTGREREKLTIVLKMLAELGVTMTTSGDVEVALDLVEIETTEDAAAVGVTADTRGLVPASLLEASSNDIMNMLLAEPLIVLPGIIAGAGNRAAVLVGAELVDALGIDPVLPLSGILLEAGGGEDAVAGGILDVHVQVLALHAHDDVEVNLHLAADALLDGEGVVLLAPPPPRQLRPYQRARDQRDDHRPLPAARRPRHVLRFRLGCFAPAVVSKVTWDSPKGVIV